MKAINRSIDAQAYKLSYRLACMPFGSRGCSVSVVIYALSNAKRRVNEKVIQEV